MLLQVILEGLGLGVLLVLICTIGIRNGAVGMVHTHDITVASKLIRSDDEVVYGDSGFVGIQKRPEIKENEHLASIDYRIVRRPGSLPKVSDNAIDWERFIDHRKASIRCKVEHVFRIVKRQFGYAKNGISRIAEERKSAICVVPQLQSLHAGTCRTVFQKTRDRLIRGDYAHLGL